MMALDLADYELVTQNAVKAFWGSRAGAVLRQQEAGVVDQGERAGVTGGKNMDGFVELITNLVRANGLADAQIHLAKRVLALPGYYRPTKLWDILVMRDDRLIAALELKSQVGPSFGNNFNNRAEEAIGTAHDLWTAYKNGAFGDDAPPPFVGWLMLVEDAEGSRRPVRDAAPHFPVSMDFQGASYLRRYDVMCQRLMQEQLYTSACVIASPRDALTTGAFADISDATGLKSFVASFAGRIATEAALV